MIFQEPMTSLNPLHTIEKQITECLPKKNNSTSKKCIELLKEVGIDDPEQRLSQYPHQLSGGQRQRIMIAMAIFLGTLPPDQINSAQKNISSPPTAGHMANVGGYGRAEDN